MCVTAYLPLNKGHYFTLFCPCGACGKGEVRFLPVESRNDRRILCPEDGNGNSRIAADSEGRTLGLWACPGKSEEEAGNFQQKKLAEFFSRLNSDELQGFFPLPSERCGFLSIERKPFLQLTEIRFGPTGLKVRVKNEKKPLLRYCDHFDGLPVFKSEKKRFHTFFTGREFTVDDIFEFFEQSRTLFAAENPDFSLNSVVLVESNNLQTSMISVDFQDRQNFRKFPISHD